MIKNLTKITRIGFRLAIPSGGHLFTSALLFPLVWGLWWTILSIFSSVDSSPAVFQGALLATIVSAILVVLGERIAVVRHKHPDPGGWLYAIWSFVIPPLVGAIVGAAFTPQLYFSGAVAMFVVFGGEALWLRNWRTGLDSKEIRHAWNESLDIMPEDLKRRISKKSD